MAQLTTKGFSTLVQEWAAVVQSSVAAAFPGINLSFTVGSVLRAMAEAQASVSLWLQGLILQLLTVTRLQTSQGLDVDSFVNDYGLTRLPANPSTGFVTFSRATPTNVAIIPVGATVQTSDGTQTFTVYADPTNGAYSVNAGGPGIPGFTIPAQVTSLNVGVQNTVPGVLGNIQAGAISILQTGITGVDFVTNSGAFTNGFNAESDAALKARFVLFINSLARGTEGALGFAVQSVEQGIQYQLQENLPAGGSIFPAVTMWVDDGSGAIPATTLAGCQAAANVYRAAGVSLGVFAATTLLASAQMTLITAPGFSHPTVVAQVAGALQLYIQGLGLGLTPALGTLSYLRLAQIAFDASPGVTDVIAYTLNGQNVDLVPAAGQTIKVGSIVVS